MPPVPKPFFIVEFDKCAMKYALVQGANKAAALENARLLEPLFGAVLSDAATLRQLNGSPHSLPTFYQAYFNTLRGTEQKFNYENLGLNFDTSLGGWDPVAEQWHPITITLDGHRYYEFNPVLNALTAGFAAGALSTASFRDTAFKTPDDLEEFFRLLSNYDFRICDYWEGVLSEFVLEDYYSDAAGLVELLREAVEDCAQ